MNDFCIHVASAKQTAALHRNVHEMWGDGEPVDKFVETRLRSAHHNRATWWVATQKGEVVCSLGCLPLHFGYESTTVAGFGIAAVYTVRSHRKMGLAHALCKKVIAHEFSNGAQIGLLYSDIAPNYYEKLGFQLAAHATYSAKAKPLQEQSAPLDLIPFEPKNSLHLLIQKYASFHSNQRLFIARNEDHWRYSLKKCPTDRFYWLGDIKNGYVRVSSEPKALAIAELILMDAHLETAAFSALGQLATKTHRNTVVGWFVPTAFVQSSFKKETRILNLPMYCFKSRPKDMAVLSASHLWPSDHF